MLLYSAALQRIGEICKHISPRGDSAGRVEPLCISLVLFYCLISKEKTLSLQRSTATHCCQNRRETLGTNLLCCCLQPACSSSFVKDGGHKVNVAFLWRSRACFSQLSGTYDTGLFCFMRKFVIEAQAWNTLSMAMELQLEQARDQYIWRQREALAK